MVAFAFATSAADFWAQQDTCLSLNRRFVPRLSAVKVCPARTMRECINAAGCRQARLQKLHEIVEVEAVENAHSTSDYSTTYCYQCCLKIISHCG